MTDQKEGGSKAGFEATTTPTRYVTVGERKLSYRTFGSGDPLVLCNRFRGTLDTWDPLFLELLAENYTVYYFDYSAMGNSSGTAPNSLEDLINDTQAFLDGMKLGPVYLAGWSLGGVVVQGMLATHPESIRKLIILGSNAAGKRELAPEPAFGALSTKPFNDLHDEEILFFEPTFPLSVAAAKASHEGIALRTADTVAPVSMEILTAIRKNVSPDAAADRYGMRDALLKGTRPILAFSGDHDISFPVENWYALVRQFPTVRLMVYPKAGHAVHFQYPHEIAGDIDAFLRSPDFQPQQ